MVQNRTGLGEMGQVENILPKDLAKGNGKR